MPYQELSESQKERYLDIAGYPYREGSDTSGYFKTDRPFNKSRYLSPWDFRYEFQPQSGNLFVELSHRMTNNRAFGWDQEGDPLPRDVVEAVFPNDLP